MYIKEILDKLLNSTRIDFSGRESKLGLLAVRYDKNKDSVFEKEEIQEMIDALTIVNSAHAIYERL